SFGWWLDNVRVYFCKVPSAPGAVTVSNSTGASAKMTWTAATPNSGFTIAHYVVKRSGGTARTLGASARSARWSGLTKGKTYTFSIYAVNNKGVKGLPVQRRLKIT